MPNWRATEQGDFYSYNRRKMYVKPGEVVFCVSAISSTSIGFKGTMSEEVDSIQLGLQLNPKRIELAND